MYQQPHDQQQQYYPPPPSGQYNAPPTQYGALPPQAAPQYSNNVEYGNPQHVPPPNNQPYTEGPEKIKPASGWNDVWATVLWLLNLGAFIGLAVVALQAYNSNKGSYNGVQSGNQVSGLTFDTATFIIFGFAALVGFVLSFLYLILAQM